MAGMSIDTSEVMALARDIAGAGDRVTGEHRKVVSKGAVNVKKQLRAEMGKSVHFKGVVPRLSYEMAGNASFSEATFKPGSLAHIAYWGGPQGGGTVPDPQGALDAEAPGFFQALEDLAVKSVLG